MESVFFAATKDMEFWSKEVVIPGTLLLARGNKPGKSRKRSDSSDTGPTSTPRKSGSAKKKKKYKGDDLSVWMQPIRIYTKNRKGFEICRNYNTGKCGSDKLKESVQTRGLISGNKCMGPHPHTNALGPKTEEIRRARPIGRCPRLNQRNLQSHANWQPRPSRPSFSPQVQGG